MFERYIDAMEKTGDITLQWYYQKEMLKEQLFNEQELDRLADALAPRILSRISITVDASDIIKEIEKLNKSIDDLGR
ncbi:MAG: hypothetical protein E7442_00770 [Ruminococcaceae bacterium]|nr:hypothetical protein [Oscillospiraceae bacterium]